MNAQARPQLTPVPTLDDLTIAAGAFIDRADPSLGFYHDSFVFTREELARFAAHIRKELNQ